MSDPSALRPALDALVLSCDDDDYAATGFHRRGTASAEHAIGIAEAFRDAGYVLEMLTCEDRRADLETMRLVYTYNRIDAVDRHLVVIDVAGEIPGAEAPSIAAVFPAADWMEREVYDMYGVAFTGHPGLKRILLPDDADFHALLKDFGRIEDAPSEEGEGA